MSPPATPVLDYKSAALPAPPMTEQGRHDTLLRVIAIAASLVFVFISITATVATYRVNFLFLIPLMWLPYWLRGRLLARPVPFAMYALAITLHDLGAYGLYQHSPLPFSWDILVHYYFAIPVTMMLYAAIAGHFPTLRGWRAAGVALMFMMGFGALHEIMEYLSYLLLGEERGMLKPNTSYFLDTPRDLCNNLLGTLSALTLLGIERALRSSRQMKPLVAAEHAERHEGE